MITTTATTDMKNIYDNKLWFQIANIREADKAHILSRQTEVELSTKKV